jgi:lipopolysaccharide export system permease protein
MKKLYRYIVSSFIGTFLFTFFIVLFILDMQFLWLYVDDLVGKGLELKILAELFFYMSITFIPMALPLALLLASLMCFGNFGEHYELVAMKASGISMWKVMRPLVIFSVLLSGFAFFVSNSLIPVANLKGQTLLFDVRRQKLAFNIKEGVFYRDLDNYVIFVERKGADGSSIYGVKIYDHTDRMGNTKIISADSGMMSMSPNQRCIIFTLYDGYNYTDVTSGDNYKQSRPFERMSFKQEQLKFSLKDFDMTRSSEDMYKSSQQMMNIRQLNKALDSLEVRYENKQEAFTEGFSRRWSNYNSINDPRLSEAELSQIHDTITDTIMTLQWPLLEQYPDSVRTVLVDMAIATARNAKENAAFNKVDLRSQNENIMKHKKERHKKFTLSIACLIFFFIGAPLGSIIRKGGLGTPVVVSVLFFVVYHVISTIGERMAVFGGFNMFLGVWISSLVLLPVGLFLTFKATTDAALFDGDSWKKFFQKLFKHHKDPEPSVPEPVKGVEGPNQ